MKIMFTLALTLVCVLAVISVRTRIILGRPVLNIITPKKRKGLIIAGLAMAIAIISVIFCLRDLLGRAPEWVLDYYREQLYMAIASALGAFGGYVGSWMEGRIHLEGIYYRGIHTWEQMLYYKINAYALTIGLDKIHWRTGQQKEIIWNLEDQDQLLDVARALEKNGIRRI
jgi:hypothetical protein